MGSGTSNLTDSSSVASWGDRAFSPLWLFLVVVVAAQAFLVFAKGYNWDEFLHFSQIHDLHAGRLFSFLQTLHARLFVWIIELPLSIVGQMQTVRVVMLLFECVAIAAIIVLGDRLADRKTALLAGLVYATSGTTFVHGFAIRPDPMIAALLMTALALLITRRLSGLNLVIAGVLVGISGALTVKSVFLLPCFLGAAFYRITENGALERSACLRLLVLPLSSVVVFTALLVWHRSGVTQEPVSATEIGAGAQKFLGAGLFQNWRYTVGSLLAAPVLVAALIISWGRFREMEPRLRWLLLSFALPLVVVIFYRNTYPYFFVFLFAPITVAALPGLLALTKRYSLLKVGVVLGLSPILALFTQPYWLIGNQRAQIDEIQRLFPEPAKYLSFSGYIPDFARVVPHLMSGPGLDTYRRRGVPVIAKEVDSGSVGFVLADTPGILAALQGRRGDTDLLWEDYKSLEGNFLHYTNAIWLTGKKVCPTASPRKIRIVRPGNYSIDGGALLINGVSVDDRASVLLDSGLHSVRNSGDACVKLWNFEAVPRPPLSYPVGPTTAGY